ncbi:head-tail adaptor [Cribrihabitans marinus]|uniref:Head-tail adaptor n=1 Tax=Cribrihabitans marinus TaxID=1227549 RepID=A0A1H6VAD3_9RHOB|nr:head-tail adaptor protein [Cribrihabitans marinus]GGH26054.1 tail protein [Cribrihabitans marinus]SEJ01521.1 head-tail adaptor [Cribrihabitans marinus]
MKAPHLNRRLVLEAPTRVPDGAGGYVESWAPLGTVWTHVSVRGSGGERAEAGMPVSRTRFRIVLRGAPVGSSMRPAPDQRLTGDGRIYVIRAVAEHDPAGRYLTCFADEEVAA